MESSQHFYSFSMVSNEFDHNFSAHSGENSRLLVDAPSDTRQNILRVAVHLIAHEFRLIRRRLPDVQQEVGNIFRNLKYEYTHHRSLVRFLANRTGVKWILDRKIKSSKAGLLELGVQASEHDAHFANRLNYFDTPMSTSIRSPRRLLFNHRQVTSTPFNKPSGTDSTERIAFMSTLIGIDLANFDCDFSGNGENIECERVKEAIERIDALTAELATTRKFLVDGLTAAIYSGTGSTMKKIPPSPPRVAPPKVPPAPPPPPPLMTPIPVVRISKPARNVNLAPVFTTPTSSSGKLADESSRRPQLPPKPPNLKRNATGENVALINDENDPPLVGLNFGDVFSEMTSHKLRKVDLRRSPGGTPVRVRTAGPTIIDSSTDPAAFLADALKKKFAGMNFKGDSPLGSDVDDSSSDGGFQSSPENSPSVKYLNRYKRRSSTLLPIQECD